MHFAGQFSTVVIVAALIAFAALATGAIMFISGDQAMEKIGVLFALFGTIIPTLVAALRSDQAASRADRTVQQTNGNLDSRIANAVAAALQARRATDHVLIDQTPRPETETLPASPKVEP